MGRTSQYTQEDFFQATLGVINKNDSARVTILAIAKELGAPTGSIYHRYSSLQHVLAETWLTVVESFQNDFVNHLNNNEGLKAALNTPRQSRLFPDQARLLLCFSREELIHGLWPVEVRTRAQRLKKKLQISVAQFIKKQPGKNDEKKQALIEFSIIHMPVAATKPWIKSKNTIPAFVDDLIEESYRALMRKLKL